MSKIIDITVPLSTELPVWPGTEAIEITPESSMANGDVANTLFIKTSNHVGTHMDAPRHFIADGQTIDELPLEITCGKAKVIELDTDNEISVSELEKAGIEGEERILIKSKNSAKTWWTQPFLTEFVHFSDEAAQYLIEQGVKLVGIDYLSVSGYNKNEVSVHNIILGNNVWIIEGLKLKEVEPGYYELICLPLKLKNGDGAPCRAILRTL